MYKTRQIWNSVQPTGLEPVAFGSEDHLGESTFQHLSLTSFEQLE